MLVWGKVGKKIGVEREGKIGVDGRRGKGLAGGVGGRWSGSRLKEGEDARGPWRR